MASFMDGDPNAESFVRLLLAFGDVAVGDLLLRSRDAACQEIMSMMHQLLKYEGYAVADDALISEAVQFWATYVEDAVERRDDSVSTNSDWLPAAKQHVSELVEELWFKMRYPPPGVMQTWDSEAKKGFSDFRIDVRDLLETADLFLGIQLLDGLVNITLQCLPEKDWLKIEASLFCVNALGASFGEHDTETDVLSKLFGSSLFNDLSDLNASIPVRVRRTAMDTFEQYSEYFTNQPTYLPSALTFLFTLLATPSMANYAAKSIHSLCSASRKHLTSELDAFFQQYERFLTWPTAQQYTKEKVLGGIAAIVQALPEDDARAVGLQRVLGFVEADVQACIVHISSGQTDEGVLAATNAMQALASAGKACQLPDEKPIELDFDHTKPNYWRDGPGSEIQNRIVQCMFTVFDLTDCEAEVVEAICEVLKSGFTETVPGPFVFPPRTTLDFILRVPFDCTKIDEVLTTACAYLRSYSPNNAPRIDEEAATLLQHLVGYLEIMGDPGADPELAHGCIDAISRYMPRYTMVLMQVSPDTIVKVFNFVIQGINSPEVLPKRAACSFWTQYLSIKNQQEKIQQPVDAVLVHFGPSLATALIRECAGRAILSDIDTIAPVLRAFVGRHPDARRWLTEVYHAGKPGGPPTPDSIQDGVRSWNAAVPVFQVLRPDAYIKFIEKLKVAKELRRVKEAILAFWNECKTEAVQKGIDLRG